MNHPFLKSPHGESPVIVETEFRADVARIFRAWTTPDDIKRWFGAEEGGPETASVDLVIGGAWEFTFAAKDGQTDSLGGKYLAIDKNRLLKFSWVHTRSSVDGKTETSPESMVTVNFEERSEGSFIRLVHESISTESSRMNIGGGWGASMSKLQILTE